MNNRMVEIEVEQIALDPVAAELRITVRPEQRTATTELRGRLMGPSCPYASTVEIAYPLRPLPGDDPLSETLTCRVLIPEPSLWEPQCPFVYIGPVELWQDGQRSERAVIRRGLRQISVGGSGLRINGRLHELRGVEIDRLDEPTARELREVGANLLLVPVGEHTRDVWSEAERLGFLVLGRIPGGMQPGAHQLRELAQFASCLGWVYRPQDLDRGWPVLGQGLLSVVEGEAAEKAKGAIRIDRNENGSEILAENRSLGRLIPFPERL